MAKAIALTRSAFQHAADPIEVARTTIVLGCALALVFAGQAFPF